MMEVISFNRWSKKILYLAAYFGLEPALESPLVILLSRVSVVSAPNGSRPKINYLFSAGGAGLQRQIGK